MGVIELFAFVVPMLHEVMLKLLLIMPASFYILCESTCAILLRFSIVLCFIVLYIPILSSNQSLYIPQLVLKKTTLVELAMFYRMPLNIGHVCERLEVAVKIATSA